MINPSTGEKIIDVSEATEEDVNLAIEAAHKAFRGEWRDVTCEQRADMMLRFAALLEKNLDEIWKIEALNTGKPFDSPYGCKIKL